MLKADTVKTGISLLRWKIPKSKINFDSLGYRHANGKISFATENAAQEYAKNRVVKALNAPKPFERGLVLRKNQVLYECDGDSSSVVLIPRLFEKDCVSIHGHPDVYIEKVDVIPKTIKDSIGKIFHLNRKNSEKTNGITLPISIQDFRTLMTNSNENKSIVYNSKGEYSILTKKVNGKTLNEQELKEIENEYKLEVQSRSGLLKIFDKIRGYFLSTEHANELGLKRAQEHSQEIHEFMLRNNKYVEYTTNYSNLCNPKA